MIGVVGAGGHIGSYMMQNLDTASQGFDCNPRLGQMNVASSCASDIRGRAQARSWRTGDVAHKATQTHRQLEKLRTREKRKTFYDNTLTHAQDERRSDNEQDNEQHMVSVV